MKCHRFTVLSKCSDLASEISHLLEVNKAVDFSIVSQVNEGEVFFNHRNKWDQWGHFIFLLERAVR